MQLVPAGGRDPASSICPDALCVVALALVVVPVGRVGEGTLQSGEGCSTSYCSDVDRNILNFNFFITSFNPFHPNLTSHLLKTAKNKLIMILFDRIQVEIVF